MSNPKRRARAARVAAALALFAVAAAVPQANAAVTRALYQKQIHLVCDGGDNQCDTGFQLGAKQRLELEQVICRAGLNSSAHAYTAFLYYPIAGADQFRYHLSLDSKSYSGANTYIYIFGQDGPFIVPAGKRLTAALSYNGMTPAAVMCTLHGTLVTLD